MKLRSATPDDLPQLAALEASCNPHPWTLQQLQHSLLHDCIDVFDDGGNVVAMLLSKSVCAEAEIYLINTAAAYRRQGLAKQLIQHLAAYNSKIFLEVRASNVVAQHAYAALGFQQIAVRRAYYVCDEGREDAVMMQWAR